jgi:hypothetical protein
LKFQQLGGRRREKGTILKNTKNTLTSFDFVGLVRFEVLTKVYEECRLLGYKTQFVPHRKHIISRPQSPVG